MTNRLRLVLFLCLTAMPAISAEKNAFEIFHEANQLFDNGNYESAIIAYRRLLSQGYYNSDIHLNLGNSHFRNNQLGHSIFHYKKALELSPRDADIMFNLNYAREKVSDQVENKASFWDRLLKPSESLGEKESAYLFAGFFLSFLFLGIIRLYKKHDWLRLARNILMTFTIFTALVVLKIVFFQETCGVVTSDEIKVYSGIGKDNTVLFVLHQGTEFIVTDSTSDQWVKLDLADGKKGWARSDGLAF